MEYGLSGYNRILASFIQSKRPQQYKTLQKIDEKHHIAISQTILRYTIYLEK